MRQADVLRGVLESLDKESTEEERIVAAQVHALAVLRGFKLSELALTFINEIGPDSPQYAPHWKNIAQSCADAVTEGDTYNGDAEHLLEYVRMVVALCFFKEQATLKHTQDVARLEGACEHFRARYLSRGPEDYAQGLSDYKARVLAGAAATPPLHGRQFDEWMADLEVFLAKGARHEYTSADIRQVRDACMRVVPVLESERDALAASRTRLADVAARHHFGPAHLEALEHQWRSYKVVNIATGRLPDDMVGALQPATVTALATAETYCWAPTTVQAVASAADALPGEFTLSRSALGALDEQGKAGWWWFQEPLPIQTSGAPGDVEPVVAPRGDTT